MSRDAGMPRFRLAKVETRCNELAAWVVGRSGTVLDRSARYGYRDAAAYVVADAAGIIGAVLPESGACLDDQPARMAFARMLVEASSHTAQPAAQRALIEAARALAGEAAIESRVA
jgi:hypothetical protein